MNEKDFDDYVLKQMYEGCMVGTSAKSDDGSSNKEDDDKEDETEDEEFILTHE